MDLEVNKETTFVKPHTITFLYPNSGTKVYRNCMTFLNPNYCKFFFELYSIEKRD